MPDVLGEHGLKVAAAEDEHPVEAFAPYGADHALTDGVGPGCSDRALDDSGALRGEDGVEGSGELGVAIADEEPDCVCVESLRRRTESTWKKSQAINPFACEERNSAQVGPDLRGDGSTPWRFGIAQAHEAAMTMPMVASSPWMRR